MEESLRFWRAMDFLWSPQHETNRSVPSANTAGPCPVTRWHDDDDCNLVWIPEPQDEVHPYFGFHEGHLTLFVGCAWCHCTTRAYPTLFTFVACVRCGDEIPIAWNVGIA